MRPPDPWLALTAALLVGGLAVMAVLRLISPQRFAQAAAGVALGLLLGLAAVRLPLGGGHG
ncbi:MAG: hypothetical protein ACK4VY_03975 [Brevundimonas sp.]